MKWIVVALLLTPPSLESEDGSETGHYGIEVVERPVWRRAAETEQNLDNDQEEKEYASASQHEFDHPLEMAHR